MEYRTIRRTEWFLPCQIVLYILLIFAPMVICLLYTLYGQRHWLWIAVWTNMLLLASSGFFLAGQRCLAWLYVRTVIYVWEKEDKKSLASKGYEIWVDDCKVYLKEGTEESEKGTEGTEEELAKDCGSNNSPTSVIANEGKQSRRWLQEITRLLRRFAPRNDSKEENYPIPDPKKEESTEEGQKSPFYVAGSNPLSLQLRRNKSYCISVRDKHGTHINSMIYEPDESRFVDLYWSPT